MVKIMNNVGQVHCGGVMKKKFFIVVKVVLTIISFVGVIIFKSNIDWNNIKNNYFDMSLAKEIAYDISIGIFSAMILVWFIDEINNHIQERQSRIKELTIIKLFDKVLQTYIEQYITMYYCVVTPLLDRKFDNVEMPEQFTLKDMRDLHQTSLLVKEGFSNGSVDSFLEIELELRRELISLIQKYEFEYYPQFAEIFSNYIQVSIKYDCRASITSNANLMRVQNNYSKEIHDLLEKHGEDYYDKAKNDENFPSTIIHPYMYLYDMMRVQRQIILNYQNEMQKIIMQQEKS